MNDAFSLDGKCALVTGASRGLGRGMAEALAEAGADVVCASTSEGGTDATAAAVRETGQAAWQVAADLGDRAALDALTREVNDKAGAIDILVNNAGTIRRHPATEFPTDDWDTVLKVNLDAVFLLSRHFGKRMIERGRGKIINVASLLSYTGGITVPAYTASKHGVAGLTKALANEWAEKGVQVNAIAPGYFRTDNTKPLREDEKRAEAITERIPAGRWGEPEDLAGAVVFLASPASAYVNGHVLIADGGFSIV
ncbi:MAG: 2-deoxy-D-gluconate 3-dehydrogenase [Bacteroidetes bacterium QS_1_65_9]|nr:MAG: 2-deoxy-D-gluconate 3-dehydrogenase [Bacteroidetes bacterium QS_1_65_9]